MMPTQAAAQTSENLPPLRTRVITRDGAVFDATSDRWSVPNLQFGFSYLNWSHFGILSPITMHKLKLGIVHYGENFSFSHMQNIFSRFLAFYKVELSMLPIQCEQLTLAHLLNYRAKLHAETEWKLGVLRILFLDMEAFGYSICSSEAVRYLQTPPSGAT